MYSNQKGRSLQHTGVHGEGPFGCLWLPCLVRHHVSRIASKMDFFKKRAREILMNDTEMEYEGVPMPLGGAYKSLKHAVKNPSIAYAKEESKPNYMKMTFSMGRQAPAGAKLMEMSQKNQIGKSVNDLQGQMGEGQLNPLLLSLKEKGGRNLFGK